MKALVTGGGGFLGSAIARILHGRGEDVTVFGRIAGEAAAEYVKEKYLAGKPHLDHVRKYEKERRKAGVGEDRKSPILLPDYVSQEVKDKRLDDVL